MKDRRRYYPKRNRNHGFKKDNSRQGREFNFFNYWLKIVFRVVLLGLVFLPFSFSFGEFSFMPKFLIPLKVVSAVMLARYLFRNLK